MLGSDIVIDHDLRAAGGAGGGGISILSFQEEHEGMFNLQQ